MFQGILDHFLLSITFLVDGHSKYHTSKSCPSYSSPAFLHEPVISTLDYYSLVPSPKSVAVSA